MLLSLPGRVLAVYFFWTDGEATRPVAVYEGTMGALTTLGLMLEWVATNQHAKKSS
jgi:hypothetical protein